jgi:hypothetical protein
MQRELSRIMVETGLDHFKAEQAASKMIGFINEKINETIAQRDGLSGNERSLAAYLLLLAKEDFVNHTCGDVDAEAWEGWTIEEKKKLIKDYYDHIYEPGAFDENHLHLDDWELMKFLAHKLKPSF